MWLTHLDRARGRGAAPGNPRLPYQTVGFANSLPPPYRIEAGCDRRPCLSHLKPPSMAVSPNALCLRSASSRAPNTVLISNFSTTTS